MRKYQISHNAKKGLLASCALFIFPLFISNAALAQNEDERLASIPANNIAQVAPRITLDETDKIKLRAAVNSGVRVEMNRDKYRHPEQTIEFFGIKPDATVVEIWPGQGWYTSILGPYLKSGGGHLVAANFDTSTTNSDLVQKVVDSFKDKFSSHPETYGDVQVVPFGPRSGALVADGTADAVLTFRNIHNWMAQGWSDKAFEDFYRALKPGGILGIEEHRADDDTPQDPMAADGYVRQDYVISLAKDAGFELVDASEINANPRDTKDHPFGVWTLPPVLRNAPMGQAPNPKFDSSRYNAIGESDRMTLLFRKPLKVDKPPVFAEKSGPTPIPVLFGEKKAKKGKSNIKTALADNPIISGLNPIGKKAEETNTNIKAPNIEKPAEKTETTVMALNEVAKPIEAKSKAVILTKPPNWSKGTPKPEAVKADANIKAPMVTEAPKETNIVKTDTDAAKTIVDTTKANPENPSVNNTEIKPEIPVLPENIITQDKPTEALPEQKSEVKPTVAKTAETKADAAKTVKEEKPATHKKPEAKTESKAKTVAKTAEKPATKAKADTKEKAGKSETAAKGAKGKANAKADSKEDTRTNAKGAKGTKATNSKTSSKTSAKNAAKDDAKSDVKANDKKSKTSSKSGSKNTKPEEKATKAGSKTTSKSGAKTDSKTTDKKTSSKTTSKTAANSEKKPASKTDKKADTKAKTTAKPAAKSKNANVPDWSSPKKHK